MRLSHFFLCVLLLCPARLDAVGVGRGGRGFSFRHRGASAPAARGRGGSWRSTVGPWTSEHADHFRSLAGGPQAIVPLVSQSCAEAIVPLVSQSCAEVPLGVPARDADWSKAFRALVDSERLRQLEEQSAAHPARPQGDGGPRGRNVGGRAAETRWPVQAFVAVCGGASPSSGALDVRATDAIWSLKARLEALTRIPAASQRLVLDGKQLPDGRTAAECGIVKGSTLRMTSFLCGGGGDPKEARKRYLTSLAREAQAIVGDSVNAASLEDMSTIYGKPYKGRAKLIWAKGGINQMNHFGWGDKLGNPKEHDDYTEEHLKIHLKLLEGGSLNPDTAGQICEEATLKDYEGHKGATSWMGTRPWRTPEAKPGIYDVVQFPVCAEAHTRTLWQRPDQHFCDREKAEKAAGFSGDHLWPTARGPHMAGGASSSTTPFDVSDPANLHWKWHHPKHKWATFLWGVALDDVGNFYVTAWDALRKFGPSGELLWEHVIVPLNTVCAGCLYKGGFYAADQQGNLFCVSKDSGELIWYTQISLWTSGDNGFVGAGDNVVIAALDGNEGTWEKTKQDEIHPNCGVAACDATDGTKLWMFYPDQGMWNFLPSFANDGSVGFQDLSGNGYRLSLKDGSVLWKSIARRAMNDGGPTWTDGSATLGSNGFLYCVNCHYGMAFNGCPGDVRAIRWSDGQEAWRSVTPMPPNNAVAIGRTVGSGDRLSVVVPVGQQCTRGFPTSIRVLDALTGEFQWRWTSYALRGLDYMPGPGQELYNPGQYQAGEFEGCRIRNYHGVRDISLPNPWSAPTISADGTIYIGNQDGQFCAIRRVLGGKDDSLECWEREDEVTGSLVYRGHSRNTQWASRADIGRPSVVVEVATYDMEVW